MAYSAMLLLKFTSHLNTTEFSMKDRKASTASPATLSRSMSSNVELPEHLILISDKIPETDLLK